MPNWENTAHYFFLNFQNIFFRFDISSIFISQSQFGKLKFIRTKPFKTVLNRFNRLFCFNFFNVQNIRFARGNKIRQDCIIRRRATREVFLKKVFFFKIDLSTTFKKLSSRYNYLRSTFFNNLLCFTYSLEHLDSNCVKRYGANHATLKCNWKPVSYARI